MQLRELFEQNNKTAVLAFGRMNPITVGHKRLAETIKSIPGDGYIFLSHKQNSKTDPLNFETKLKFAKECFPGITVGDSSVRTIIEAIKKVNSLGYTNLVFVAGSDRVNEFAQMLNAYNNREYFFESIEVVNAGARDPNADGIEGISASKLREAAINNDIDTFLAGTPPNRFSLEMFNAVRNNMIENNNVKKNDLISAFEKFFPIAMKVLDIDKLPKIKLEKYLDQSDQPSFGRFENNTMTIYLGLADRHPIDILRTLAHELVHFKQLLNGQLNKDSGKTGSPDENEAHVKAGIVMRLFDKKYPEFFKSSNIDVTESISHTGKEMLKIFRGMHHDSGMNKDMDRFIQSRDWKLGDFTPDMFPSEEEFFDYDDPFDRVIDIDYSHRVNLSAPIIVGPQYSDGKYSVIDGNHRAAAAQRMSKTIQAYFPVEKTNENFADGKKPGRKGLAKRSGVNTKASVSSLRKTAKNSSGEKQRMAHWLANMKAGRAKKKANEAIAPHGSPENEFQLMKAGTKPAALVDPDRFLKMYKPVADKLGWPYQQIKLADYNYNNYVVGYNNYVVGQPGEEKRVQRLATLLQDMNANLALGIKPTKEYHIEMGRLLGYSNQDIQDFLKKSILLKEIRKNELRRPKTTCRNKRIQRLYALRRV